MNFKPQNFRRFKNGDSVPDLRKIGTFILIKGTGEAAYARTRGDKDHLVAHFDEKSDLLLFAWPGQYHTDIFLLTRADLENHGDFKQSSKLSLEQYFKLQEEMEAGQRL